jgi:hypothetical protein
MASHALDWGDSLNQRRRGDKRNTMVMMFVGGGVVFIVDGILVYSYRRNPMGHEFFVPARTLIGKAVNPCLWSQIICDHLNY